MKKYFFYPWIGKDFKKGLFNNLKVLVIGASHHCPNKQCPHFKKCTNKETRNYNTSCPYMDNDEYSPLYPEECDRLFPGIVSNLESITIAEVSKFLSKDEGDNCSYRSFTYNCIGFFGGRSSFSIDAFTSTKKEDIINRNRYLWDHIAFANLSQNYQPESKGNDFAKSYADEDGYVDAFYSYIYELAPDVVIVWGDAGKFLSKHVLDVTHQYNQICKKDMPTTDGNKDIAFLCTYHPLAVEYSDVKSFDEGMKALFTLGQ